jgi:hypothetical protein
MLVPMGRYLDAKLRAPSSSAPSSIDDVHSYGDAVEYGLAQHQGVKSMARSYPSGNWETPAGYYFQAVDIASQRTSPVATAISMLRSGDAYARAEVDRLGIGKPPPDPYSVFAAEPNAPAPQESAPAAKPAPRPDGWTGKGTPDDPLRPPTATEIVGDRPSRVGGVLAAAGIGYFLTRLLTKKKRA